MYNDYYSTQAGSGLPVFSGSRGQNGYGLGSIFGGLFRSALPMLKQGLSTFGKQALRSGLDIVTDLADGRSFQESAKDRFRQGIKSFATDMRAQSAQSGNGVGRKKRKRSLQSKSRKNKKKIKRSRDIFS